MFFKYRALGPENQILEKTAWARTPHDLAKRLGDQGLETIDIHEVRLFSKSFSAKDLALLFQSMALLTKGGLDFPSIFLLLSQQKKSRMRASLEAIREDISRGLLLSEAFRRRGTFPPLVISMIRAGEESSSIGQVLEDLGQGYKRRASFRDKVINAVTYPLILLVTSLVVVLVLLNYVLPIFKEVFAGSQASLPWQTRLLIGLSEHFQAHGSSYLLALLIVLVLTLVANRSPARTPLHRLAFRINPVYRSYFHMNFIQSLNLQLSAGVPLLVALENIQDMTENAHIRIQLDILAQDLKSGQSLAGALEGTGLVPQDLVTILHSGEEASTLPEVFEVLSHFLQDEIESRLIRLAALLEPILILVMAFFVAFLVFAIAIPMFDLSNLNL